jgi:ABC-2 type transport system ATP-binding protein
MDEAERCHKLAYIAYGKLLAQGTAAEVVASQNLTTWSVEGDELAELSAKLQGKPGIGQTVVFGTALHVTGKDAAALEQSLRQYAGQRHRIERIETNLEDVFIHMMGSAQDNVATQSPQAGSAAGSAKGAS